MQVLDHGSWVSHKPTTFEMHSKLFTRRTVDSCTTREFI
jgi:hypothetical protein